MIARTLHSMGGVSIQIRIGGEVAYVWRDQHSVVMMESRLRKVPSPWSRLVRQLIRDHGLVIKQNRRAPDQLA